MISKKIEESKSFLGEEGTEIRQIFHPHNTLNGINFSLAHSIILSGKRSKPHKMKSAEVYFVLQGEGIIHVDDETRKIANNCFNRCDELYKDLLKSFSNYAKKSKEIFTKVSEIENLNQSINLNGEFQMILKKVKKKQKILKDN